MSTVVTWYSSRGISVPFTTTSPENNWRLLRLTGTEPVSVAPVAIKSPSTPGDTTVDVIVPGRVISLSGIIQGQGLDPVNNVWVLRAYLMSALAQEPVEFGQSYELGRLVVEIDNRQTLEIECLPQSVSVERPNGSKSYAPFDIEFYAPNPYWCEPVDSFLSFQGNQGFGFPITPPLEPGSNNVSVIIDNQGDVSTPILARLYGDITTARLINETTGKTFEIEGNLPATKYWEIDTRFGGKRVDEVTIATGARVTALSKLNLAEMKDTLWLLKPGPNIVTFEADVNTSGHAEVYWRERFSGF